MATYTIHVTLDTGANPPVIVSHEVLTADFGSDTIFWTPASDQSGWDFVSIAFNPSNPFHHIDVHDHTIQVHDDNEAVTDQTVQYFLYVEKNGMVYGSDPYVLNDPKT